MQGKYKLSNPPANNGATVQTATQVNPPARVTTNSNTVTVATPPVQDSPFNAPITPPPSDTPIPAYTPPSTLAAPVYTPPPTYTPPVYTPPLVATPTPTPPPAPTNSIKACKNFEGVKCKQCNPGAFLYDGKCFFIPTGCSNFSVGAGFCLECAYGLSLTTDNKCI